MADSTSTVTLSPSTDSESAIDAALSRDAWREALASRAEAAFAALVALVVLGLRGVTALLGNVPFLVGELARGRPLARGVALRCAGVGGGRCDLLSFAVNVNFGGGEIDFLGSSGFLISATGESSSNATIQGNMPYSSASSSANYLH